MSDIAELRDGTFSRVGQLDMLDECFLVCFTSLMTTLAHTVEIRVKAVEPEALPGVHITRALGEEGTWTLEDGWFLTKMEHLIAEKNFVKVLEIAIPKNSNLLKDD